MRRCSAGESSQHFECKQDAAYGLGLGEGLPTDQERGVGLGKGLCHLRQAGAGVSPSMGLAGWPPVAQSPYHQGAWPHEQMGRPGVVQAALGDLGYTEWALLRLT